jgi:hypothetical protein
MNNSKSGNSRRNFLLAVGTGGAAAVAAIGAKTLPTTAQPTAKRDPKAAGYQLSDHVRNYYRTTLV